MTTDQVIALRHRHGFRTALQPVEPGQPMLICNSRGTYEWLIHPDDLLQAHAAGGYPVGDKTLPIQIVDVAPMMGAIHIRVTDPDRPTGYVDPSETKQ